MGPPPKTDVGAVGLRALHEPVDALEVLARDLRPDVGGRRRAGRPARIAGGRLDEPLEELVVDRTRSTSSRVPARQTCPALSNWFTACFTTRVEVGVGERDERRLAAELERDRGEVRAGGLRDELAGRDASR